jgi:23S rRNA (adenine2030-N6)-methyltransferase
MLSYRHEFHAGNFADVLKHSTLLYCLDYIAGKNKPFMVIDTHSGAGYYNPQNDVLSILDLPKDNVPKIITAYSELVKKNIAVRGLIPGSPAIIRECVGSYGKCFAYELHPQDFQALTEYFKNDNHFIINKSDGFNSLKSLLPPIQKRALIFMDPPYEDGNEYQKVLDSVAEAVKRFPVVRI